MASYPDSAGASGAKRLSIGNPGIGTEFRGTGLGDPRMSTVQLPFQHLDHRMQTLADADVGTRIRMIEKDLFIEHDYSRHLGVLLNELITGPRQTRMPCLLIVGD